MARTMLHEYNISQGFWAEAVNTTCYALNRVLIRPIINKTPYKKPKIAFLKVFGSKCFVLRTKKNQDKFSTKSNEGIFLGYSSCSKAYRVFFKSSQTVIESLHVDFDEYVERIKLLLSLLISI